MTEQRQKIIKEIKKIGGYSNEDYKVILMLVHLTGDADYYYKWLLATMKKGMPKEEIISYLAQNVDKNAIVWKNEKIEPKR